MNTFKKFGKQLIGQPGTSDGARACKLQLEGVTFLGVRIDFYE